MENRNCNSCAKYYAPNTVFSRCYIENDKNISLELLREMNLNQIACVIESPFPWRVELPCYEVKENSNES